MIELRRHGSFFEVDADGFVIPKVSAAFIQPEWQPIIKATVDFYQTRAADKLIAVYIRGSVAKGEALPHISDLDSLCVTASDFSLIDHDKEAFNQQMKKQFPFCTHVELVTVAKEKIFEPFPPRKRGIWAELIKTQSVCVFGLDISTELPAFRLEEMIGHAYYLAKDLKSLEQYLEADKDSPSEIKDTCVWICRRIVRAGFDLVMLRVQKFTRDLYLCYEVFARHYPSQAKDMRQILELGLNPSSDVTLIKHHLEHVCPWLLNEIELRLLQRDAT